MNSENPIMKILMFLIPFLLGLFSSLIIDKIRLFYKKKKIKNFIIEYLRNSTLRDLSILRKDYLLIKKRIFESNNEIQIVHEFEGFNARLFYTILPADYFEIFKKKYILLNEIISIIEFLSDNLPLKINNEYFEFINKHLKDINLVGKVEHLNSCRACINKKEETLSTLDHRIKETDILIDKINELLRNCG